MIDLNTDFTPYNIPLHGVRLPSFSIPEEYKKNIKSENGKEITNFDFLRHLCLEGFKKLNLPKKSTEYESYANQTKKELDIINELGFVDYILLVWNVINFCKTKGIAVGLGRGSAAGSLVLFLIGVTGIDPIKHELFFERFISKTRAKKKVVDGVTYLDGSLMCDIDMDICFFRRHEVINYLYKTFDKKASKILTLNTLSGKLLIKECGKIVCNKSETEMNEVAGYIPKIFGNVEDIETAYETVPQFKEWCDKNKRAYEIALSLRDLIKNKSVHASGIMLSYDEITENCPLEISSNDELISGYDMKWASQINVKLDCLGLRAVSVVDDICKNVGIKMEDIDVNDPFIYQNLYELKSPHGIFQIEAHTAFKTLQKVKPKNIEELSGVLAIARPGALQFLEEYSNYTNNGTCKNLHPFFDDVFGKTANQCLYQEQLISAIRKIGFSPEEGELVRRCVTGDTKFISKTRGFISINTLLSTSYKDDLFLTLDEHGNKKWQKISNIWSNGLKQTRYVEANNGFSVRASMYHQFLTNNGWKSRMRLEKGDFLYSPKSVDYDGEDLISVELAIIIAGLATEGYFPGYSTTTFTNFDKYIYDLFGDSFYKEFGKLPIKRPCGRVWAIAKPETIKINKYLQYGLSASKVLPEIMMGMTKETTRKFLSFILACEGGISQSNIEEQRWFEISSKSEKFANQIHLLLLRFGIYSKLRRKKNPEYGWFYHILIKEYSQLIKLKNELTILWPEIKKTQLDALLQIERQVNFSFDVIPQNIINKLANQYPFVVSYESGKLYSQNVNRETFKRLCEKSNDKTWIDFSNKDFFFNAFESQERDTREIEVFDFSMEDENCPYIVANGLVIHNCVGKKDHKGMAEWEEKIKEKVSQNKLDPQIFDIIWKIAQDSASYSFNKCLSPDTVVETENGNQLLYEIKKGDKVLAFNTKTNNNHFVEVKDIHNNEVELFEVEMEDGRIIKCSMDHKFLCNDNKMHTLKQIIENNLEIMCKD